MKQLLGGIALMVLIGAAYSSTSNSNIKASTADTATQTRSQEILAEIYRNRELEKRQSAPVYRMYSAQYPQGYTPPTTCTTSYYQSPRKYSAAEVTTTCR